MPGLDAIPLWAIAIAAAVCGLLWAFGSGKIKLPTMPEVDWEWSDEDNTVQGYYNSYKNLVTAKHGECARWTCTTEDNIKITFQHQHGGDDESS